MSSMDCGRAQELFSDHRDGTLDLVLRADLETHLAGCDSCRDLRATFEDLLSILGGASELEEPAGLAERAATAALVRGRAPQQLTRLRPAAFGLPLGIQALAASLAILSSGVLLWTGRAAGPRLGTERLVEHTVNAGVYLVERKDRLMEDLRILRVVIGTAFEGRLDRVNDRVDDYRRLLERRKRAEEEGPRKRGGKDDSSELRSAKAPAYSLNPGDSGLVPRGVIEVDERDGGQGFDSRSET
jgi:Putative zinc-finger